MTQVSDTRCTEKTVLWWQYNALYELCILGD